jgi:nucleotide-binding universal stress UspA family protein
MSWDSADSSRAFELGTDGPTAILVGVDGSTTSLNALAYAVGLARRERSRLVAVFVRTPPHGVLSLADRTGAAAGSLIAGQDETEADLRVRVARIAEALHVDIRFEVRSGDPLAVLSEIAEQVRADAVIVGSSEGVGHRLAGSLAVRLVRSRRWPVTVVP